MHSPSSIAQLLLEEAASVKVATSPEKEPLVMEPLETLTDAIELDHGMHCAPPPAASPPRKRQRLKCRSGDAAATEQLTLAGVQFYHEELVRSWWSSRARC